MKNGLCEEEQSGIMVPRNYLPSKGHDMAHRDPRQEVIAKLSRFLTPSAKVQIGADTYKPIGIDSGALGETVEGFHFLRERTIPGIPGRMMLAAINETRAPG